MKVQFHKVRTFNKTCIQLYSKTSHHKINIGLKKNDLTLATAVTLRQLDVSKPMSAFSFPLRAPNMKSIEKTTDAEKIGSKMNIAYFKKVK